MRGSSGLVEGIIRGAQKYFRGSSEENCGSVASRMPGFNTLLLFQSASFNVSLCFLSKKKKSSKTHPLFNSFLRMNCLILKRLGKHICSG